MRDAQSFLPQSPSSPFFKNTLRRSSFAPLELCWKVFVGFVYAGRLSANLQWSCWEAHVGRGGEWTGIMPRVFGDRGIWGGLSAEDYPRSAGKLARDIFKCFNWKMTCFLANSSCELGIFGIWGFAFCRQHQILTWWVFCRRRNCQIISSGRLLIYAAWVRRRAYRLVF